jgi:hypothetical protein
LASRPELLVSRLTLHPELIRGPLQQELQAYASFVSAAAALAMLRLMAVAVAVAVAD